MTTNQLVDGTLYNFKGKGEFLFKDGNFKRVYLRSWISKNSEDMTEFLDLINPEFELSPEKVVLLNLEEDIFENSRKEVEFPLLSDYERSLLPEIDNKILGFKNMVVKPVMFKDSSFCNGIIISGPPGTGKTTFITTWLEELKSRGYIDEIQRINGKITPTGLYNFMGTCNPKKVQLLDDANVFSNNESLDILKAGLDTKGKNADNRSVTYGVASGIQGYTYTSFMIMITNDKLENPSEHLKAVLDRVHYIELELTPDDMFIFYSKIIEDEINSNNEVPAPMKNELIKFYRHEILNFHSFDLFNKTNINFSVRFIYKLIDLFTWHGASWKNYSKEYKKLKLTYDSLGGK